MEGTSIVIKKEKADVDSLEDTAAPVEDAPVLVKTVVKNISKNYLSSLILGCASVNDLDDGEKNAVILGLCSVLTICKTTIEKVVHIQKLRKALSSDLESIAILEALEKELASELVNFVTKHETDQFLQQVLVTGITAGNDANAKGCMEEIAACQADTDVVKVYAGECQELKDAKLEVENLNNELSRSIEISGKAKIKLESKR